MKLAYQEAHEFRWREEKWLLAAMSYCRHGSQANQNAEPNRSPAQVCTTYTCISQLDFQMPASPLEAALACLQGVASHYVE